MKTAPHCILSWQRLFHKKLGSTFKNTTQKKSQQELQNPYNFKVLIGYIYDMYDKSEYFLYF